MTDSLSFDRASEFYDATRSLPSAVMERVVELLRAELRGHDTCLEIGVGTGRIALPLREAGITMAGVDLSLPMMAKLVEKSGRRTPFPLAVADATRLPFRDDAFGASLACHVLHLILDWRVAVSELVRVTCPGGVILIDLGGWGGGPRKEVEKRFEKEARIDNPRPGATDPSGLDEAMATLGALYRELPEVRVMRTVDLGELLQRIENGVYSFTWHVDDAERVRAARATREWAEERFGNLDQALEHELVVSWRAYDLP
ncbi:MAG: class I SAM-dependent methyltransferase [Actinomycetota bacterium]